MRWLLALLILGFGLACLNYTRASPHWEHHAEWAEEHGLPAPSNTLFYAGVAGTVLGAAALGRATCGGKSRRKAASGGADSKR